jgi:transcriptional regulator with XRE-family HTH domain
MNNKTPTQSAAEALRETREAAALTQLQLAQLLGVDEIKVSRWETGRTPIDSANAIKIVQVFEYAIEGDIR